MRLEFAYLFLKTLVYPKFGLTDVHMANRIENSEWDFISIIANIGTIALSLFGNVYLPEARNDLLYSIKNSFVDFLAVLLGEMEK